MCKKTNYKILITLTVLTKDKCNEMFNSLFNSNISFLDFPELRLHTVLDQLLSE